MFTLELDLIIYYVPPMSEIGGGIHLTRELQLPFAPYNGLQICGKQLDEAPGPDGFVLKDVTWDVDRQVFMAYSELYSHDLPMVDIPVNLKSWVDLGWRIGSYAAHYEEPDDAGDDEEQEDSDDSYPVDDEFEQMLEQPMLSPRQRQRR